MPTPIGHGDFSVYSPGSFSAGSEVAFVVPAGEIWRVWAVTFALTTSVAIAARRVAFTLGGTGSNRPLQGLSAGVQTASLAVTYTIGPAVSLGIDLTSLMASIPFAFPMWALGNFSFATTTLLLQAGDQFSNCGVWREKFISSE